MSGLKVSANQIDGGATRGTNLFHSFAQFSVPTNGIAFFNNASSIQNIISRVTGGSISNIDGLIRANGKANLFLINPNGIIFGPNASLNIGGSFVGSTASSLNFADGTKFSATAPQTTPLLTISVPIGLQFGGNPGRILVQGDGRGLRTGSELIDTPVGLHVASNQTLAMVGGDVALSGATLKTAGGRIELGSVAGSGLVSLTPIDKGWSLGYSGVQNFRDIKLSQQAAVDASGAGGGDVQVQGRRVTLTDASQIEASTLGSEAGGTLAVTASDSVEVTGKSADGNPSALSAQVYQGATGAGGNLTLKTGRLIVGDGAQIVTTTSGTGPAGNLTVTASDSVELIGTTPYGPFQILSGLFAQTRGAGAAGDLTIATGKLMVRDGAQVSAGTFAQGQGGALSVTASDSVELIGTTPDGQFPSGLFTQVAPGATGVAGNLTIATGKLMVCDGAQVSAGTFGQGQGGALSVTASDSVELIGTTPDGKFLSGLFTQVNQGATGVAGNLTIATGKLMVRDGAQVSAGTFGQGQGGALSVTASDSVELIGGGADGPSSLLTQTFGAGAAGELRITTGNLLVQDGARVSASTSGQGNAGSIQVNATNSVNLSGVSPDGFSSGLFTSTSGVGQAGNITVNSDTFRLADGAVVSALTRGEGKGGNITVNANTFEADNGGQVLTTTRGRGNAGDIKLNVPSSVTLSGSDRTYADRLALRGPNFINNEGAASGLFANTASDSTGNGGTISIDPIKLTLTNGASVAVSSFGKGNAGNLQIQAGTVTLDREASLSAAAASGEGGIIKLQAQDLLLMRHGSQISAVALGTGNGGNITINTPFIVTVPTEDSNIITAAIGGRGGNIGITASGIFGIQPNDQYTSQSYISASSQLGISGLITNPRFGLLVNLPVAPVDASRLIAQGCPAGVGPRASKFVITGRGGLPPNPSDPLSSDTVWTDLRPRARHAGNRLGAEAATLPTNSTQGQLVEAQGWVTNDKGEVVLVASAPSVTPDIPWLRPTTCYMQ